METLKAMVELTKPRALFMIIFTTGISYLIAMTADLVPMHLLHTCVGVAIAAGGSLALNQHMERNLDAQMERTKTRPIPSGRISPTFALIYGYVLMIGGYLYLWLLVNPACSIATMICGISYLYLYTPMKLRSSFSSFVGAIPGGMLPIMGWVGARNKLEIGAWVLFVILFLWQIPHALIISIRHQSDYEKVGMKQLPLISHQRLSYKQIIWNILVMIPVSLLPTLLNMTEYLYPVLALILGIILFWQMMRFVMIGSASASKGAFISLTAYLPLLLIFMYLDKPS